MPYDPLKPSTPEPILKPTTPTYDPTKATATNYTATTQNVGDQSLVSNQVQGLLSKSNPYMKQAETQGLKLANRRGLLNSSMAVGAVEGERIKAALPIAQQDAATFGNQALENQKYTNAASQFGAENTTRIEQQNVESANKAAQFNTETQAQKDLAEFGEAGVNYRANLEADMRAYTANLEASTKDQEAFLAFANENNQQFMVQVSEIMRQPNTNAHAKEAMIADLQSLYKANFDLVSKISNYPIEWVPVDVGFETAEEEAKRFRLELRAERERAQVQQRAGRNARGTGPE